MSQPTLAVLSAWECNELLRLAPVGRIAITVDALPVILPINFIVVEDQIVFRTVSGTKLAAATANAVVAFEIDSYEPDGHSGWSVLVQGKASEITDPADRERVRALGIDAWAIEGEEDHVVRIDIHKLSGRRFTTSPS
jgi:uncharacterized protein